MMSQNCSVPTCMAEMNGELFVGTERMLAQEIESISKSSDTQDLLVSGAESFFCTLRSPLKM